MKGKERKGKEKKRKEKQEKKKLLTKTNLLFQNLKLNMSDMEDYLEGGAVGCSTQVISIIFFSTKLFGLA
jgi:hypothetical protein